MDMHVSLQALAVTVLVIGCTDLQAQELSGAEYVPTISRMCLWNADDDTWNKLDLAPWQVARMRDLRQHYPAVVNGQWILTPEMEAADRGVVLGRANATLTVDAGDIPAGEIRPVAGGDTMSAISSPLQSDLRLVLSAKQIIAWKRICR